MLFVPLHAPSRCYLSGKVDQYVVAPDLYGVDPQGAGGGRGKILPGPDVKAAPMTRALELVALDYTVLAQWTCRVRAFFVCHHRTSTGEKDRETATIDFDGSALALSQIAY
jgi:hypothetical protein